MTRPRSSRPSALALAVLLGAAVVATTVAGHAQGDEQPSLAFLARADTPVDVIAAGATAGKVGAPVLLSASHELSPTARDALVELRPGLVVVVGGTAALSQAVEDAVGALGFATRRVAGEDRLGTAAALARFGQELPLRQGPPGPTGHSATVGADGLGLISYHDFTNGDLKVAHCSSAFCVSHLRRR